MPRPFSLTIRSIEKDNPKTVMIILSIASILLGAWNLWFFFAQTSVYESSIFAKVDNYPEKIIPSFSGPGRTKKHKQNLITASFPIGMKNKIFQGQKGFFFPAKKQGDLSGAINVLVIKTIPNIEENTLLVNLKTIELINVPEQLQAGTQGLIKLEIANITPFKQVLNKLKKSQFNNLL